MTLFTFNRCLPSRAWHLRYYIINYYTVEPPNKGHVGDNYKFSCFVLYREIVLF